MSKPIITVLNIQRLQQVYSKCSGLKSGLTDVRIAYHTNHKLGGNVSQQNGTFNQKLKTIPELNSALPQIVG